MTLSEFVTERATRGLKLPFSFRRLNPRLVTAHDNELTMPNQKILSTPYPLIDADPHATRVVRYFRTSDWATWAAGTAAFPASLALWGALPYSLLFQRRT